MLTIREQALPTLDSSVKNENLPPLTPTVPTLDQQEKNSILGQVEIFERVIVHLLDNSLSSELQKQVRRKSDKLTGSLETLGLTFAAQFARSIGLLFQGKMPFEDAVILQLAEFVITLRELVEREATKNNGTGRDQKLSSEKASLSSKS